jgi:hypothetical protein
LAFDVDTTVFNKAAQVVLHFEGFCFKRACKYRLLVFFKLGQLDLTDPGLSSTAGKPRELLLFYVLRVPKLLLVVREDI